MAVEPWVGEEDVGIPAKGLFVIVFTFAGYVALCVIIHVILKMWNEGLDPPSTKDSLWMKLRKSEQFWFRAAFFVLAIAAGGSHIGQTCGTGDDQTLCGNWHLMYWFSVILVGTANISNKPWEFYLGEGVSFQDTLRFYLRNEPLPTEEEIQKRVEDKYFGNASESTAGIGFWTLMPSVFITWIFAKSIRNSSVLGARFGIIGGFAYCSWYLSFFSSAIVCYILRTRYNFKSLPTAVYKNYGAPGMCCLLFCVAFRLFNEVWSNATVVGGFFGATGSSRYWGAAWFSVLVPTTYVIMGGMRSSLFSDIFQAGLAVVFLAVILFSIQGDTDYSDDTNAFEYSPDDSLYGVDGWQPGWWAYTIAGTIGGVISYPWFDPVLTDRCFLGTPKTMLKSFLVGGLLAMSFIFCYSIIGVYGAYLKVYYTDVCGCSDGVITDQTPDCPTDFNPCSRLVGSVGEASDVAYLLGERTFKAIEVFVNLVMITASLSTLDSTFSSAAKLVSLEIAGWLGLEGDNRGFRGPLRPVDVQNIGSSHMMVARLFMVFLLFAGTSFLGYERDAMNATTVAGMMIMGIGPPIWMMAFWRVGKWRQAPLAMVIPFAFGSFVAISYYLHGKDKTEYGTKGWTYDLNIGTYTKNDGTVVDNAYGRYLGTMLLGHGCVIVLFFIFFLAHQLMPWTDLVEPESNEGTTIGHDKQKTDGSGEVANSGAAAEAEPEATAS